VCSAAARSCSAASTDSGLAERQRLRLAAAIAHARTRFGVPIYSGLPFGHCRDKLTLPFGGHAELEVAGGTARLRLSGYGAAPR
jgi:muramoyltetrapeptide carboxypeptidase LdcA involved in peptidoglycan recycling